MIDFTRIVGFDWDRGNALKNDQHGVTMPGAEQVFFVAPLLVTPDEAHSRVELRFRALVRTLMGRRMTIIFILRGEGTLLRVISARDMHRKERTLYGHQT